MNTGYTRTLSLDELAATEEETLRRYVAEYPANEYWAERLQAFLNHKEQERQTTEANSITVDWLGDEDLGSRCIISGGEVIELDAPLRDDEFASWDNDPGYF